MSMTTRNFFKQPAVQQRDTADAQAKGGNNASSVSGPQGPMGAGFVDTEDEGKPSMADGADEQSPASLSIKLQTVAMAESDNPGKASVQSPASLQGNVVASCTGAEGVQK